MHWTAYEIFSVISGACLVLAGLFGGSAWDRVWSCLGGAALIGYGVYVAGQESGTYYFPIYVFVIPFILVAKVIYGRLSSATRPTAAAPYPAHYAPPMQHPDPAYYPPQPQFVEPPQYAPTTQFAAPTQYAPQLRSAPQAPYAPQPQHAAQAQHAPQPQYAPQSRYQRPAPVAQTCRTCGNPTRPAAAFCGGCGTALRSKF